MGNPTILRRAEFKRQRKYRARNRKRNPLGRLFKRDYADLLVGLFATPTPFLACLQRGAPTVSTWGGQSLYFDVTLNRELRP